MKKISLLSLAFASAFAASAQNIGDPDKAHKPLRTEMSVQPRFGIKAGVNLATLEIDDDSQTNPINTNNKTSFHAGLFANIPLSDMWRFQPEVVYSGQGSKVSQTALGTTVNDEWDMHYVNVPLMFQLQTKGGFFVEAGPHVGFLVKAKDEDDNDLKDALNLKSVDFGAGGGIGYLSRIGLGINARYNLGFANIYDDDANSSDDGKLKNRVVNIGLVYHFGAAK